MCVFKQKLTISRKQWEKTKLTIYH